MRRTNMFWVVLFALFTSTAAWAAVPQTLHYSGKLDTAGGGFTGTVDVTFALYEDANAVTSFWSDTQAVTVTDGRFHVELGPLSAADVDVAALHLGVTVGTDDEMDKVAISSVPYALRAVEAGNAATVGGQAATAFAGATHSHALADLDHPNCTSGQVLTFDGSGWICGTAPVLTETDPKVASVTTDAVPRWDGSQLADSLLTVDGNGDVTANGNLSVFGGEGGTALATFERTDGADAIVSIHAGSGNPQIVFDEVTGGTQFSIGLYDATNSFHISENSALGTTDRLVIRGGKVGVGTSEPFSTLDVNGALRVGVAKQNYSTAIRLARTSAVLCTSHSTQSACEDAGCTFDSGACLAEDKENAWINFYSHEGENRFASIATFTPGDAGGVNYNGFRFKPELGGVPTTAMTILPGGNIGIGTANPSRKLEVDDGDLWVHTSGGARHSDLFLGEMSDNPGNHLYSFITDDAGNNLANDLLEVRSSRYNLLNRWTRATSGDYGAGDKTVASLVGAFELGASYQLYGADADNTVKVQLHAEGDSYFLGGNVGIGKNDPSHALDVSGSGRFSGVLTVVDSVDVKKLTLGKGTYTSSPNPYEYLILSSSNDTAGIGGIMHSREGSYGTDSLTFFTYDSRDIILKSPRVGINNSEPSTALDVTGTVTATAFVGDGSGLTGTVANVAADSITATHIAADAVGTSEVASNAIGNAEMANNAIGSAEVIADSLVAGDIAANAVGNSELANDAVYTANIKDLNVNTGKIADDAITAAKIATNAVGASEIAANAVGTSEININNGLSLNGYELVNARSLQLKDWDDNTGGDDEKYRILARDGAFQVYNGGFVVGNYNKETWPTTAELPTGTLIVEGKAGIGVINPTEALEVNGNAIVDSVTHGPGTPGTVTRNVAQIFTDYNGERYWHLEMLPIQFQKNSGHSAMYHIHVRGYAYHTSEVIDLTFVGYKYDKSGAPTIKNTEVLDPGDCADSKTAYFSTTGKMYLRFRTGNLYFTSFTVDSMYVGNGLVLKPGDIKIWQSSSSTL